MNGGIALVVEVDPQRIERRLATRYLDERAASLDDALARVERYRRGGDRAVDRARRRTPPTCCRRSCAAASSPDVLTDQTSAHDALNGYVPERPAARPRPSPLRRTNPDEYVARIDGGDGRRTSARCSRCKRARRRDVRLRQQHPRAGGERPASPTPSRFPASCPSTSGRCSAKARDRSAGPRSRAIRRTSAPPTTLALEMFAGDAGALPLDPPGARARRVPGTAGAHPLARLRRARALRPGDQRARPPRRRQGADRHRPRSSRRRIGRLAEPRDRGHARRQRRDRRLAGPERAAEHVVAARRGCRCTTAAASASATRCTPAWSSSPTARREADEKLERVLTCDPGIGVVRHADAGYPEAIATARRARHRMPSLRSRGIGAMMIPERPSLERRVLAALDGSAGGGPRIPVVLGGCGTGRTSLLLRLRDLIGRTSSQYIDVERIATTPERFLAVDARRLAVPGAPYGARRRRRAGARAALRRGARVPRHGPRRRRRAGDVPARRVPRAAHVRELPGPAHACCAISSTRSRSSGNRFVLTTPLRRARAPPAARRAGAVRDHPRPAADAGRRSARRCPARRARAARPDRSTTKTIARATSSRGSSTRSRTAGRRTRA